MFIAKGCAVSFKMLEGGRRIACPKRSWLLHDPRGKDWSANSVLIARFDRTGQRLEVDDSEVDAFKSGSKPKKGWVDIPAKDLEGWSSLGRVEEIYYTRVGEYADDYEHPFDQGWWIFQNVTTLWRRGSIYRLEMPEGAEYNWRGFCWP